MRLSGGCSNQSQLAVVREAAEARSTLTTETQPSNRSLRPRLGAIQAEILMVLREADGDLSRTEIQRAVEYGFRRPISAHTVTSFLSKASRDNRDPVERVEPGRYRHRPVNGGV